MYENRYIRPISFVKFLLRILAHSGISIILLGLSLLIGMIGFMYTEDMTILDAFLNSSMLLGGMGPIKTAGLSDSGKLFSGIYALYYRSCFNSCYEYHDSTSRSPYHASSALERYC